MSGYSKPRYRLRIGRYRAVYEIDDKDTVIVILFIGPRGDVYKQLLLRIMNLGLPRQGYAVNY